MKFSLEEFERLAYTNQYEEAARQLLDLLFELDKNYGHIGENFFAKPLKAISLNELDEHIWTRIAAAITCLFSDPKFQFSSVGLIQLLQGHRWFSSIFAATPFRNADHIVRCINILGSNLDNVEVETKDLVKFCLLYTPESEIPLNLDQLWNSNQELAVSLCMALLSPRFLGSPIAHQKREQILPWLTKKLTEIKDINTLPFGILHDVYMHCSYADRSDKHDIKKSINLIISQWLVDAGINPIENLISQDIIFNGKPVMLVVLEWFNEGHSIFRTHSRSLESARELFHLIGMGLPGTVDEAGRNIFDEYIEISDRSLPGQLREIQSLAANRKPQVFYMPSVGMFQLTIYLSNLRLAPIQAMALGHPATSNSLSMDYVVVEEDYIGDPTCFSEKLLVLPKDGMPYRPSSSAMKLELQKKNRRNTDIVNIAVASSVMKLNPGFLSACAQIIEKADTTVHFHFLVAQAQGITYPHVRNVITQFLNGNVTVYPHQKYADYMQVLASTDMFINPFPFGNTNGIIDAVTAGLVGINKTGPEVHEHIDQGLFERLSFPDWLTTRSIDEYIAAAVRLVNNATERNSLSRKFSGEKKVQRLFKGRPEILGVMFADIYKLNSKKNIA